MSKKTRKQEVEAKQEIDPDLKRIMEEQYARALQVAGMGYQPNRAPTIAGFTPQQMAAMNSTNDFARAFGSSPAPVQTPTGPSAQTAMGMRAYSTGGMFDEAISRMGPGRRDMMNDFFKQLRGQAKGKNSALYGPNNNTKSEDQPDKLTNDQMIASIMMKMAGQTDVGTTARQRGDFLMKGSK